MDLDGWVHRQFTGCRAENAESSLLGSIVGDGEAKHHRLTGGKSGAVSFGQHDHSVNQLAVTAGLDLARCERTPRASAESSRSVIRSTGRPFRESSSVDDHCLTWSVWG